MDVTFQGLGCAISMASASLMTSAVKGKTRLEAKALFDRFLGLITGSSEDADAGFARQAGGVLRGVGIPDQGQVRQPVLACHEGGAGPARRRSVDRVGDDDLSLKLYKEESKMPYNPALVAPMRTEVTRLGRQGAHHRGRGGCRAGGPEGVHAGIRQLGLRLCGGQRPSGAGPGTQAQRACHSRS